jgi:heme exporter protein C
MEKRFPFIFIFAAISFLLTMAALIGTFYITPLEVQQIGFTQKIFYFHVPMAITSATAFLLAVIASVMFLITREKKWDTWAYVSVQLGLLFGVMLFYMGDIWTRAAWGSWWTWDPRLTSFLVVLLLYSGYFVLRSSVEDESQRARYSAALAVVSYVAVIFTMISTRVVRSIHPVIFTLHSSGVESSMLVTFLLALHGMLFLMGAIYLAKVSLENLEERMEILKDKIGD